MSEVITKEPKYCQSCIERGINPPSIATREWQVGIYYCDECFSHIISNMTALPTPTGQTISDVLKTNNFQTGPVLDFLYNFYQIPPELQFDSVDTVCRNYDKIFNFHAPAVLNRDIDSIALEIEQLEMSLFIIKYRIEPLTMQIGKLKEERRKEKGLKDYKDSTETYAKNKPKVKETQAAKLANKLGLGSADEMADLIKKAREREFNKLAGNCAECGNSLPCSAHPNENSHS